MGLQSVTRGVTAFAQKRAKTIRKRDQSESLPLGKVRDILTARRGYRANTWGLVIYTVFFSVFTSMVLIQLDIGHGHKIEEAVRNQFLLSTTTTNEITFGDVASIDDTFEWLEEF